MLVFQLNLSKQTKNKKKKVKENIKKIHCPPSKEKRDWAYSVASLENSFHKFRWNSLNTWYKADHNNCYKYCIFKYINFIYKFPCTSF